MTTMEQMVEAAVTEMLVLDDPAERLFVVAEAHPLAPPPLPTSKG